MYKNNKVGAPFENMAKEYLQKHGLNLVVSNYRCRYGEIDLIMNDDITLVFVEVRKRTSSHHGSPLETVDYFKQQKIIRTAYSYLQDSQLYETRPCRFDVVGVTLLEGKYHLEWCQHAYEEG